VLCGWYAVVAVRTFVCNLLRTSVYRRSLFPQGHLRALAVTRLYTYLSEAHSLTSIALLIGLGASRIGSGDQALANLLAVHLPSLQVLGTGSAMAHLEVPPLVQTAAIVSTGLLYLGSGDRRHAELMLDEISIAPTSDRRQERECHALSAGLALGMVCVGKGGSALLHDLHLARRLFSLLSDAGASHLPATGFTVATGGTAQPLPPFGDTLYSQGFRSADVDAPRAFSSLVLESAARVSPDVTAPAALVALALVFLRTGNRSVLRRLAIPNGLFLLQCERPHWLSLRATGLALVGWQAVRPTHAWVAQLLPPLLRAVCPAMRAWVAAEQEDAAVLRQPWQEGATTAERQLGDEEAPQCGDRETVQQSWVCAVSGACVGLALRYAGTHDRTAASLIRHYLLAVWRARRRPQQTARRRSELPQLGMVSAQLIEMCLCQLALSLAVVMSGSGDLECFRLLRRLHRRSPGTGKKTAGVAGGGGDADTSGIATNSRNAVPRHYGSHMALGLAIGLLFLGGGQLALGTDDRAVASLLATLYPILPRAPDSVHYHLQALRHLYVLAAEQRCLCTRDSDTDRPVCAPVQVRLRDGTSLDLVTPCLLPELSRLDTVRVCGPHYHAFEASMRSELRANLLTLYVKRCTIAAACGELTPSDALAGALAGVAHAHQHQHAVASHLRSSPCLLRTCDDVAALRLASLLAEAASQERGVALSLYVGIADVLRSVDSEDTLAPLRLLDVRTLLRGERANEQRALLPTALLDALWLALDRRFEIGTTDHSSSAPLRQQLLAYYGDVRALEQCAERAATAGATAAKLSCALSYWHLPTRTLLRQVFDTYLRDLSPLQLRRRLPLLLDGVSFEGVQLLLSLLLPN
jgi:APC1 beta sandwich domain